MAGDEFVRCMNVQGHGPERRIARFLKDDRLLDVRQPETAHVARCVGGQQSGPARLSNELASQRVTGTMFVLALLLLQRNDLIPDEVPRPPLQVTQLSRQVEIQSRPSGSRVQYRRST